MAIKISIPLDMNGLTNLPPKQYFQEDLGECYPPYLRSKPRKRKETKDPVSRIETKGSRE